MQSEGSKIIRIKDAATTEEKTRFFDGLVQAARFTLGGAVFTIIDGEKRHDVILSDDRDITARNLESARSFLGIEKNI